MRAAQDLLGAVAGALFLMSILSPRFARGLATLLNRHANGFERATAGYSKGSGFSIVRKKIPAARSREATT